MDIRAILVTLLFVLIEVNGKELDPGPQAIKESAEIELSSKTSTPKSQKRYATQEIILYLTPSQIRALQAGKGLDSPLPTPQPEEIQKQQREKESSLENHEEFIKQQFENIKSARISSYSEPQYENLELISHTPSFTKEELSSENLQRNLELFDFLKQHQSRAEEQVKTRNHNPQFDDNEQTEQWNVPKENESAAEMNAWITYGSVAEKNQDRLEHEQLKQQWSRILEQNRIKLKALPTITPEKKSSQGLPSQTEKPLLQTQYAPRYNDQKKAIEIEKHIRQRHREALEKQSALEQAEAIANAPPILVHQEVKITKHHPVPIVKHVKVSVPTPVLIPVPEPYEVKVPHPYPVPLEIIKPIPVPILKTEKLEVEKPIPYEVEKRIPVPVTKKVFVNVDRPYYVQKLVPVEVKKEVPVEIPIRKPEKITILRHVWDN